MEGGVIQKKTTNQLRRASYNNYLSTRVVERANTNPQVLKQQLKLKY